MVYEIGRWNDNEKNDIIGELMVAHLTGPTPMSILGDINEKINFKFISSLGYIVWRNSTELRDLLPCY